MPVIFCEMPDGTDSWVFDDDSGDAVGDRDLTLSEALQIAEYYGGGEFDGEVGQIVEALICLGDAVELARQALDANPKDSDASGRTGRGGA